MPTIKDSVKSYLDDYVSNGNTFYATQLFDYVWWELQPRQPFQGSILRKLRECRQEGYKIKCIDHQRSEYRVTIDRTAYDRDGQGLLEV